MTTDHVGALEQLVAMKERGLITDAEYETKRADILARLAPAAAASSAPATTPGRLVIRTYRAKTEAKALELMAADRDARGADVEHRSWAAPSFARAIVTPILLLIAGAAFGALFLGMTTGLTFGGIAAFVYLVGAIVWGHGTLTVTYRRP